MKIEEIIKQYQKLGFVVIKNEIGNYDIYYEGHMISSNINKESIIKFYLKALSK